MISIKISLAAARVNAKKTQADIAREMHVTRATIANWESGKTKMSEADLLRYSDLCSIPAEYIFLPYEFAKSGVQS